MSQMSSNFKYISMNQKCRHLVFLKILSAVTPECVVDRLRRFNVYIWLLKPIYSQHKCQFMQNTFGNTGQRMDSIRISASKLHIFEILEHCALLLLSSPDDYGCSSSGNFIFHEFWCHFQSNERVLKSS